MIELNKQLKKEIIYDRFDYDFRMNYYFRRYKTYTRWNHIFIWDEIKSYNTPIKKNIKTKTMIKNNFFYTLTKW